MLSSLSPSYRSFPPVTPTSGVVVPVRHFGVVRLAWGGGIRRVGWCVGFFGLVFFCGACFGFCWPGLTIPPLDPLRAFFLSRFHRVPAYHHVQRWLFRWPLLGVSPAPLRGARPHFLTKSELLSPSCDIVSTFHSASSTKLPSFLSCNRCVLPARSLQVVCSFLREVFISNRAINPPFSPPLA